MPFYSKPILYSQNKLINLISSGQKEELSKNGFLIIRNVFTQEEVTKLANYCSLKCSLLSYKKCTR